MMGMTGKRSVDNKPIGAESARQLLKDFFESCLFPVLPVPTHNASFLWLQSVGRVWWEKYGWVTFA